MTSVIQRVKYARLRIDEKIHSEIGPGILLLLGISKEDTEKDAEYLVRKTIQMRIFNDKEGKFNHSLLDLDLELMVVSQFTLLADTHKGNRPSFQKAAEPVLANKLYEHFIRFAGQQLNKTIKTGIFAADMQIELENDGPVTITLSSNRA